MESIFFEGSERKLHSGAAPENENRKPKPQIYLPGVRGAADIERLKYQTALFQPLYRQ